MKQCFEPWSHGDALDCAGVTRFSCKKERIWGSDGFSFFPVGGIEVLAVANLSPESKGIYSSTSTLSGPAASGPQPAALPTMQNRRLTDEREQELTCKSSRSVVGAQI